MQLLSAKKPLARAESEVLQETLIVINGFLHDLSTGIWLGALLIMWRISRQVVYMDNQVVMLFAKNIIKDLFLLSVISLIMMLLTGLIRAFTLKAYGWSGDVAPGRTRLLLIKHAILGLLVVSGVLFQVSLLF